ncbi:ras and EF-hand domain-containing protein homolog isoform X4 [Hydra vulgaris]|uniref:Ras and EF-hand domain-containing protein homolog isoform X4 n=1 Tax=Hydra vulgaris TaxID=6087 RepID=A0ABM4BXK3_HYDVU
MSNVDENAFMKRELLDAELDSSGFIDEVELAAVVDLKPYELKQIFARLDTDKDGKISITDFMENYTLFQSYADVKNTSMQPDIKTNNKTEYFENGKIALKENSNDSGFISTNTAMKIPDASSDDTLKVPDDTMRILDATMSLKNSSLKVSDTTFNLKNKPLMIDLKTEAKNQLGQEYLDDLYEIARSRDDPLLLDSLENFLAATVDNLLRKQAENEYLELSLKRATLKNNEFSSQLEQEMDQHVQMLEEKIRQEEQQKLAIQKQEAYQQLIIAQKELAEMENKVKMLEKQVEEKSVKTFVPNTILEEIKLKEKENETLHLRLLEFQTQMALMRTEVAKLKCEYDEQSDRLQKERVTVLDCVQEQENLTRQLHLLHEANKKLHDTNDDLRSAMEVKRSNSCFIGSPVKRTTSLVLTKYRLPNLHSSFRSDPGPDLNNILNDFDDTDIEDASGRSIIPYDEEVIDKSSLMAELMEADDQVHNDYMSGKKPVRVLSLENSASSTPQKHVDREQFVRQLEVLCETNRRLGESNDELREALGILSERLRPPELIKKPSGCQSAPVTPSRRIYSSPISSSPQKSAESSHKSFVDTMKKSAESSHKDFIDTAKKEVKLQCFTPFNESSVDSTTFNTDDATESSILNREYHRRMVDDCSYNNNNSLTDSSNEATNIESTAYDDESTAYDGESTVYDGESTVLNTCCCGKIIFEDKNLCKDCTYTDTEKATGISDTFLSSDQSLFDNIHTESSDINSLHVLPAKTDMCTQVDNNLSLCAISEKHEVSVQCELPRELPSKNELNVNQSYEHNKIKLLRREAKTNNHSLNKTQLIEYQFKEIDEIVHGIVESSLDKADSISLDHIYEKHNSKEVSQQINPEKPYYISDYNFYDIFNDHSINQVPESTILTDSDDSNNYSDQETGIDMSMLKRFKPVGEESNELSMRSQRQFDEDVDDYNMPDEELARLVNQTNDDDFSSTSEELITVEEKIIEPHDAAKVLKREFGVGADTSGESLSANEGETTVPERMYKLVLVGNAAVGKSSFIIRLCKNKFYSSLNSTLGVDFQIKNLQLNGKIIALQLWDTAGQERFRSIAKSYFRKVDGVILMYDVTCESSFMDVRDWLESIKEGSSKTVPIIICGNKTDLRLDARRKGMPVVSQEQGQRLANDIGALFIETSAKEGTNITNTCLELTKQLIQNDEKRLSTTGMQLNKQPSQTKKNGCCR